MKKHPKAAFRFGSAVAAMLVLTLLLSLTACFNTPSVVCVLSQLYIDSFCCIKLYHFPA